MTHAGTAPDTIVLIHGFWVTPRSWEDWVAHYERKGYRVVVPGYPGFEVEVEALNADPAPVEALTIPAIVVPPRGGRRRRWTPRRSSSGTPRAGRSPRSSWTTDSAPPGWR